MPYEDKIEHDVVMCKPRIAPAYSQGNELVVGRNAWQLLIAAMSLCSLVDNSNQGISSANGLT